MSWECHACTYANDDESHLACIMCHSLRMTRRSVIGGVTVASVAPPPAPPAAIVVPTATATTTTTRDTMDSDIRGVARSVYDGDGGGASPAAIDASSSSSWYASESLDGHRDRPPRRGKTDSDDRDVGVMIAECGNDVNDDDGTWDAFESFEMNYRDSSSSCSDDGEGGGDEGASSSSGESSGFDSDADANVVGEGGGGTDEDVTMMTTI